MISILMPVYNAAPFLTACLDSIRQQTEKEWELIAVDDHSTDNSLPVLREYAQKDRRIRVFNNMEKGIIPALRLAFNKCRGAFITRMDADDLMPPQKLQKLLALLNRSGEGYLSTGMVKYFSEGQLKGGFLKYEAWINRLLASGKPFEEVYRECVIPSPCWMVDRADLVRCGAFHRDIYPEDYDLCFRFYKHKLKVVAAEDVLHLWRDHPGRTSRNVEVYAEQTFFNLKVDWFLRLDRQPPRPLVLWGAGNKGKSLARRLIDRRLDFRWVCDTPSKWGRKIYGHLVEDYRIIPHLNQPQLLVAVSAPKGRAEILRRLEHFQLKASDHYFLFC